MELGTCREVARGSAHRQLVAESAEAGDHADCDVREIGVPPERLTRVSVREVHFDEWQPYGRDSVPQRHACMREGGGIENEKAEPLRRCPLDALDELVLRIALERAQLVPGFP